MTRPPGDLVQLGGPGTVREAAPRTTSLPEMTTETRGAELPSCCHVPDPLPAGEEEDRAAQRDLSRRFLVAAISALATMLLAMGPMLLPGSAASSHQPAVHASRWPWIELLLASPAVFWAGWPFAVSGARSLREWRPNMFALILVGVSAAMVWSIAATVAPGLFPASLRNERGQVGVYYETAAVIVALVLWGQRLETVARARTGAAVRELFALVPETARRMTLDGEETVPVASLRPRDFVRLRPGDRVPTDGVVREGIGTVDEAMLTGEPLPVTKQPGDALVGGTTLGPSAFVMRVTAVGAETVLARIAALVAAARKTRAPSQRLADAVAARFVPLVMLTALVTAAAWLFVSPTEPSRALSFALAVLVISCPCALGLATPMAATVALGRGARHGVLIRDAAALEMLARVQCVALDKTGTLTVGRPTLTLIEPMIGCPFSVDELLRLAAAVEEPSEHPLARAVVAAARERNLRLPPVTDWRSETGRGVTGLVEGQRVRVGQPREEVTPSTAQPVAGTPGGSSFLVEIDGQPAARLTVSDAIKPRARALVEDLHRLGLRVVMLTGDAEPAARAVAATVGIADVIARLDPAGKAAWIEGTRRAGEVVAMAGDGINDAPALAAADVGLAMGDGTAVAVESAAVTLLRGEPAGIARAVRLGRQTAKIMRQNLFFAFLYNVLAIPLAAGVFVPLTGWTLSPMLAALAMSLSSLSVIANALRLRVMPIETAADPHALRP